MTVRNFLTYFGPGILVAAIGIGAGDLATGAFAGSKLGVKEMLGATGQHIFLIGAWAAIFTSMLGVWQSVPYLFADFCGILRDNISEERSSVDTRGMAYRGYLIAMATIPLLGLKYKFIVAQKIYAVLGSLILPLLALVLLLLNGRIDLMGKKYRNKPLTNLILIATILFFLYLGLPKVWKMFV